MGCQGGTDDAAFIRYLGAGRAAGRQRRLATSTTSSLAGGSVVRHKADPQAFKAEIAPLTASIVWDLDYEWHDAAWMAERHARNSIDAPISIFEVHLGSWSHFGEVSYRSIAPRLATSRRALRLHPRRVAARHGAPVLRLVGVSGHGLLRADRLASVPQDLMYLIDHLHQQGIGVILDWVPSHFPNDEHGSPASTARFSTSTPTRAGLHPDWDSLIFNYDRHEVRSFLTRAALYWIEQYHADGLRVDAVASMLYRDYSRKAGEWLPNEYGGRENLGCDHLSAPSSTSLSTVNSRTSRSSPRSPPRGRWSRARPMSAGWVSGSSGTWAGCTTRCATWHAIRSFGRITSAS